MLNLEVSPLYVRGDKGATLDDKGDLVIYVFPGTIMSDNRVTAY